MEIQIAHPNLSDRTPFDHSLHLVSAGFYLADDKDSHCVRANGRADYFLFYVYKGKSRYIMNGEEHFATDGDIVFYNYKDPQDYSHLSQWNTQVYWVHFHGELAETLLKDLQFTQSMCLHTEENLSVYFKAIIHALTYQKTHYLKTSSHNLLAILLAASHCITEQKDTNEKLEHILSLMNNLEHAGMTLPEYAAMCDLSSSQFIRHFTAYTGQTPIRYKNEILIRKAKWYLQYTNYAVSEIADFLHVDNVYYFSNLFKKHTGICPTKYRELASDDHL